MEREEQKCLLRREGDRPNRQPRQYTISININITHFFLVECQMANGEGDCGARRTKAICLSFWEGPSLCCKLMHLFLPFFYQLRKAFSRTRSLGVTDSVPLLGQHLFVPTTNLFKSSQKRCFDQVSDWNAIVLLAMWSYIMRHGLVCHFCCSVELLFFSGTRSDMTDDYQFWWSKHYLWLDLGFSLFFILLDMDSSLLRLFREVEWRMRS